MKTDNEILLKVEQAINAKVAPQDKRAFDRLVVAGAKLMYADQTEGMLRKQMEDGTPAQAAGRGAAKLLGLLLAKSKGTAPNKAMALAGIMFVLEALDFMEKAGRVEVTPEVVVEATQEFGPALLQLMGISKDRLEQLMGDAQKPEQPQEQPQEQPAQQEPMQPQQPQRGGALIGAVA